MAKNNSRTSLSRKLRFEVFKRDSFTCQYCGGKAPDILLEVDHIHPVSKGGTNDILNLITSCKSCNSGKSNRTLDDNAVVNKSRKQLEDRQALVEQFEMMLEWRDSLKSIAEDSVEVFKKEFLHLTNYSLLKSVDPKIRSEIRKYGIVELLESLNISAEQYSDFDEEGSLTSESASSIYLMSFRIAKNRQRCREKPYLKDLYQIRAMLNYRIGLSDIQKNKVLNHLESLHVNHGKPIEEIKFECEQIWRYHDLFDYFETYEEVT